MDPNAGKPDAAKKLPKVLDYDANPEASWGAEELPLLHPFKVAGVVYEKLNFRVPTGGELARIYANRTPLQEVLLDLAGIDEKIVEKMRGDDYARALKKVGEYAAGI